jgi:pimeloyl-ACP methyl ester carboxylesterase
LRSTCGVCDPSRSSTPSGSLKALALSLLAALLCAWLTACLLFYQGEWQLILHPSRTPSNDPAQTPAALNLPFDPIRFDAAETGQPRLTAWWLPASPASTSKPTTAPALTTPPRYAAFTILYLHGGSGSLSDTLPTLARLHAIGLNIFAIDYRGFGASDPPTHPTASRMAQDTAAALDYLTATRHIPAHSIIPFGEGLAAALAASLAAQHPELPAVILSNPVPDPAAIAAAARPTRLIPVRLLFRNRFDIATPLSTLTTPKLLIAGPAPSATSAQKPPAPAVESLFQQRRQPPLLHHPPTRQLHRSSTPPPSPASSTNTSRSKSCHSGPKGRNPRICLRSARSSLKE